MRLLICEDDISTINVLKNNIDFSRLGIDGILEAYNGEMAIEVIKKENPELILCDIGMPKVNGIEVLKFARNYNELMEFVFLTCYEDFKYAQLAIDYRVTGYLTKPFKLTQIEETLAKMVERYRNNADSFNEDNQTRQDLLTLSVLRQISDGLFGTNRELIQDYLDKNGMEFKADSLRKIVFSCYNISGVINSEWSQDLLLHVMARTHDEMLNHYAGCAHAIVGKDERFIWCLTFTEASLSDEELMQRCQDLNGFCREHFSIEPVILISDEFALHRASVVVSDLYAMIRKIRYYGGRIFHQSDKIDTIETETIFSENQLLWYLKNKDESGYEEYISNILNNCEKANKLEQFSKELLMLYLTILNDNSIPVSAIYENETLRKLEAQEKNKENLLEYSRVLLNIYAQQTSNIGDAEDTIKRAKKFLDDNFRENIDRDDVARVAFVTPNYLSKLFRNNMGMNLREYINQLRIDEAKRLLLSTNTSITEIAAYVGYYNISYFSTVFHKLVGVSPADWRANGKGNE